MLVQVYKNTRLNKYSVRDKYSRKVIHYNTHIRLFGAKFVVSEAGRQRVLRQKRKNVHAYVEGFMTKLAYKGDSKIREAYYNPYTCEHFIDKKTGEDLRKLQGLFVELIPGSIFYWEL